MFVQQGGPLPTRLWKCFGRGCSPIPVSFSTEASAVLFQDPLRRAHGHTVCLINALHRGQQCHRLSLVQIDLGLESLFPGISLLRIDTFAILLPLKTVHTGPKNAWKSQIWHQVTGIAEDYSPNCASWCLRSILVHSHGLT